MVWSGEMKNFTILGDDIVVVMSAIEDAIELYKENLKKLRELTFKDAEVTHIIHYLEYKIRNLDEILNSLESQIKEYLNENN